MRGAGEEPEIRAKLTESIFQELAELSRNIYFLRGFRWRISMSCARTSGL